MLNAGLAQAQVRAPAGPVLRTGDFHGGEVPDDPGTGWLALVVVDGKWHLLPTQVRSTAVDDPVVDGPGAHTGRRIEADVTASMALLRVPALVAGKVDTPNLRFKDKLRLFRPDTTVAVDLDGRPYRFVVTGKSLDLRLGERSQLLVDDVGIGGDVDGSLALLWAGDLDRDGALDFLFEGTGPNSETVCLYLSRGAPAGTMVREAGCLSATGC